MLRHVAQPLHAGGLEADVGVEAAGDGAVDDGLLLLLQQLDQLLLGADVAPDPPVHVVEEADDGGLFGEGWDDRMDGAELRRVKPVEAAPDALRALGERSQELESEQMLEELDVGIVNRARKRCRRG